MKLNWSSLTLQCKRLLNLLKHIVEDSDAVELILEHSMENVS